MTQKSISFLLLVLFFAACNPLPNPGKEIYVSKCQNCHGIDGKGLKGLYPSLVQVDYLKDNRVQLACNIKYGIKGPIEVNGVTYDGEMPGNALMSEIEITNLLNFINKEFKNELAPFTMQEVTKNLSDCNNQ